MSDDLAFSISEQAGFLRRQAQDCERESRDPRLSAMEVAQLVDAARSLHARADEMLGARCLADAYAQFKRAQGAH